MRAIFNKYFNNKYTKGLINAINLVNPFNYINKIDGYIIGKFIGTYFYSIILIISISIVFDINENLAKFTTNNAPLRAIVFDYYANFVPYFANLFSPLFVFIAVIFFTSKLAGNSEVIAMLASGMSFKRLLRPYMISAAIIAGLNFYLGAYVIPKGNVIRQNFESLYKSSNRKKNLCHECSVASGQGSNRIHLTIRRPQQNWLWLLPRQV